MDSLKLKAQLLEAAPSILGQYIRAAQNKEHLSSLNQKSREPLFEIIRELILKAPEIEKMAASNTHEVMNLLAKGKITPDQALDLMKVLQEHRSICEEEDYTRQVKEMLAQSYAPKKKKKKKPSAK